MSNSFPPLRLLIRDLFISLAALTTLENRLNDDFFETPFIQIFATGDLARVKQVFTRVTKIKTSPLRISIFCDENHVKESDDKRAWLDTKYTYKVGDATMPIEYKLPNNDMSQKPGVQGSGTSYTSLGEYLRFLYRHIYN